MGYVMPSIQKPEVPETLEDKIKAVLEPLVKEVKDKVFIKPENATDEEALGILLSKYLEWNGYKIKEVAEFAFEDANFHGVTIEID